MSAPSQDVFSRLYGGKREINKTQPSSNSAPLESTTISVYDRLYKAPSTVKFRMFDKANLKPKQLQPLFSKVDKPEPSKKDKKGAKYSKLDPRKVKSEGNLPKVALKEPEKQLPNSKKVDETKHRNALKELEKESQKQKSKVEEKLKIAASEVDQQKNKFGGEKYKKVLENPEKIELQKQKNKVENILDLNHPGSELPKQKKGCVGKKKGQHSSNSDRAKLAAESEENLGEKPFIVLSMTERANPFQKITDKKKSKDADKNEEGKEKGSNSNANSTDGIQLFGGYQPQKISKENLKLRDEMLDENRRSSLSFMKGDDQLPVPVNLENDRNSPVWHDDYYVNDEEEPKGKKLSAPAWYNPPSKERHRAGHDSGRTHTNPLDGGEKSAFAAKGQVSAQSNAKIKQVDYDEDNSGVYRAKVRRDSFQAPIVNENENTEVDLPLDDLNAEEIKDEELPMLMKKPAQRVQLRQHSW